MSSVGRAAAWPQARARRRRTLPDLSARTALDDAGARGPSLIDQPRSNRRRPVLYLMTPTGFQPDASTLQCPIPGNCFNHPSTIDLSRVFGSGFANVPLPAHSRVIDSDFGESQSNGGQAGWWEIELVGVARRRSGTRSWPARDWRRYARCRRRASESPTTSVRTRTCSSASSPRRGRRFET
jgi:hypothetical protein